MYLQTFIFLLIIPDTHRICKDCSDRKLIIDNGEVFNASAGGDNCAKWIVEIAKIKDLTITLHNIMSFEGLPIEAEILNDGRLVRGYSEYLDAAIDLL